jgi:DNA-directed RNA polymerase specialized sigma24 family protein
MADAGKKSGSGLISTLLIGGLIGGGYGYYKHEKKEEERRESGRMMREMSPSFNESAPQMCFFALAACSKDVCPWSESDCPVDEACRVLRRRGAGDDARDLAHDLLLEVCIGARPLESTDDMKNKLMYRAHRRAASFLRRWNRSCDLAYAPAPEAYEANEGDPALPEIQTAICRLGSIEQCVINRKYLDGWSDEAIATDCGLASADAVRQRRSRAIRQVRVEVGAERQVVYNPKKAR